MTPADARRPPWEALAAVAVVSFGVLAAEVALTRIFSVLFRAPYVFLIVSGAVGGLGLGGLVVQLLQPRLERTAQWIAVLLAALAAALAAPILLLFVSPWGRELVASAETAVVVTLPMLTFGVAGMALAILFRRYPEAGGLLYFVDLAGAAVAAPVAVFLLDHLGGISTPLLLAALTALVGVALALKARLRALAVVAGVVGVTAAALLGTNAASPWIDLPPLKMPAAAYEDPSHPWHLITKPLFAELAQPVGAPRLVRTDWTAVSRTDVADDRSTDTYYVYTDGDVPTQMVAWDGKFETARRDYEQFIGWLPYRLAASPPERVMAIGSGGGLDALLALAAGANQVDAVEINPAIPRVVSDPRFEHTYARTYRDPRVRLTVDEGRSFLQRAGKFDLIYFACAKTATTQTGGVALLDNHLYTVEAFRTYWRHLSDTGALALVLQEGFLADRLLVTALRALREEGLPATDAANHLLTAQVPEENFGMGPYRYILLMRREAWTPEQAARLPNAILANGLVPVFVPHVQLQGAGRGRFDPTAALAAIRAAIEKQYPIPEDPRRPDGPTHHANLEPVTDDSPFYVDVSPGLHPTLRGLLWGSGIATILVMVLAAVMGLFSLRRLPVPVSDREGGTERSQASAVEPLAADPEHGSAGASLTQAGSSEPPDTERTGPKPLFAPLQEETPTSGDTSDGLLVSAAVLYFAMLGTGFMLVELALLQWFILILGFPTRSLTVTLFALLISSAIGSSLAQRGTAAQAAARLRWTLPALLVLLLVYRAALPSLLPALLPLPLAARMALTGLLLFPAGILMGMPFPTALRTLTGRASALIPGLWSVNGVTSILGSVVTMVLAKFVGYGGALIAGAACYVVAALAFCLLRRQSPSTPNTAPSGS